MINCVTGYTDYLLVTERIFPFVVPFEFVSVSFIMIHFETPIRIRVGLLRFLFAIVKSLMAKPCKVFHRNKYAIPHVAIYHKEEVTNCLHFFTFCFCRMNSHTPIQ